MYLKKLVILTISIVFFASSCVSYTERGYQYSSPISVAGSSLGQSEGSISGSYVYDSDYSLVFSGNTFTGFWGGAAISGTFTVSGNTLTINASRGTLSPRSPRSERFTISSDFRTIQDTFGDVWYRR